MKYDLPPSPQPSSPLASITPSRDGQTYATEIAQRLHDGPCQLLAMAALSLDAAMDAPSTLAQGSGLATTRRLLQQAAQSSRRLLTDLMGSTGGAPFDLFEALRQHVAQLAQGSGAPLRFSSSGLAPQLPGAVQSTLFDATRELIRNARRHGENGAVEAHLQAIGSRLSITVFNAGRRPALDQAEGGGQGLRLHSERLAAIGASLRWRQSAEGVQARIRWCGVGA